MGCQLNLSYITIPKKLLATRDNTAYLSVNADSLSDDLKRNNMSLFTLNNNNLLNDNDKKISILIIESCESIRLMLEQNNYIRVDGE